MHKFSLKCFGVGDGWPSARNHSSFLYTLQERSILIDCGEPISRGYFETGGSYDAIDRIFISHLHFDHVGGLFMLLQSFWLRKRRKELFIHLPEDGIAPIRRLLEAGCLFDELLQYRLLLVPLRADEMTEEGTVRVTTYPSTHLKSFQQRFAARHPQNYEAYCFLLETDDLRIGHSADLGAVEDLAPLVRNPLDLLVCETAHVNPEHLFAFLSTRSIRRAVFIHLTQRQTREIEALRHLAARALPRTEISFAQDGDLFTF